MSVHEKAGRTSTQGAGTVGRELSVRQMGFVLLPIVFGEGALGVASAGLATTSASPLLIAHIVLGASLAIVAGWLLLLSIRMSTRISRFVTGFTAVSLLSTASTGSVFLLSGFSQGLVVDRVLGLASIAGTVLMIVWGSRRAGGAS